MSAAVTAFKLIAEPTEMFDGSVNGIPILKSVNAQVLPDGGISFENGFVDIGRHADLDQLDAFTIEATVNPTKASGARQNILECQTPSIAFFIESNGKLVGSVHTAAGWVTVDSGTTLIRAKVAQRVTFSRDATGKTELGIDGKIVGGGSVPGPILNVGMLGFRVGSGMDGASYPFSGAIAGLSIRRGVVTDQFIAERKQTAQRLENLVRQTAKIEKISVHLLPDESHARLQHIKDIMNAAGVQTLSDLGALSVKVPTHLARGQVLVAPKKVTTDGIDWSNVAKQFRIGNATAQRGLLAAHLTNRNSATFLSLTVSLKTRYCRRYFVPFRRNDECEPEI